MSIRGVASIIQTRPFSESTIGHGMTLFSVCNYETIDCMLPIISLITGHKSESMVHELLKVGCAKTSHNYQLSIATCMHVQKVAS